MTVRRGATLIARYGYDVLGRRIVKRVYSAATGGTVGYTRFVYKGDHVAFETDSSGTIGLRYTWGAGTDDLVAITTAAGLHYYVTTDKLGSVRSIAKRDGTWQLSQRFDPYGRVVARDTATTYPLGLKLRYGWTGREWDAETGFSFHRARYFDPESRRWTQEDPIGYAGSGNLYAYVGGSPMESRDPSGMIPSADGITQREYDKVLTIPQPTWDGWFGISGSLFGNCGQLSGMVEQVWCSQRVTAGIKWGSRAIQLKAQQCARSSPVCGLGMALLADLAEVADVSVRETLREHLPSVCGIQDKTQCDLQYENGATLVGPLINAPELAFARIYIVPDEQLADRDGIGINFNIVFVHEMGHVVADRARANSGASPYGHRTLAEREADAIPWENMERLWQAVSGVPGILPRLRY